MVFHVCLMALKENVLAENTPYPGFSYITFTENHNCYDRFNDIQCEYMQNIMHVLLDKFENEKSVFKYQIKQIKQDVKLMKKQFKQTVKNLYTTPNIKQNDENFTKKYTNGQSMKLHKVLANIDPLFAQYYDHSKWLRNANMEGGIENITNVRFITENYVAIDPVKGYSMIS